jgi:hypothetical protein
VESRRPYGAICARAKPRYLSVYHFCDRMARNLAMVLIRIALISFGRNAVSCIIKLLQAKVSGE